MGALTLCSMSAITTLFLLASLTGANGNDYGCGAQPNKLLPYPGNCNAYVHCAGTVPIIKNCPQVPLLYWNNKGYCDWPANVDCTPDEGGEVTPTEKPDENTDGGDSGNDNNDNDNNDNDNNNCIIDDGYPEKAPSPPAGSNKCARRVCYHTNWAQYRPGNGKFVPEDIDASLCTHIIYSFANLRNNELLEFEWNDGVNYQKVVNLKKQNPDLKILLAVGGWNMGSIIFSNMVHSTTAMNHFISTSVEFLKKHGFDGLDLDWEYPANRGGLASDKEKFSLLVKKLKKAFKKEAASSGNPRMLLTAAVAAGPNTANLAYDVPEISKHLDFINLMAYDLWGPWQSHTGHEAALEAGADSPNGLISVTDAVDMWLEKGCPADKLVLGLPLYGKTFTLSNPATPGVNKPSTGAGVAQEFTREKGMLSYYESCKLIKEGGSVKWLTKGQEAPTLSTSAGFWAAYDDRLSIAHKVHLARSRGLGGVMVWALDFDDFNGKFCGLGKFPLMKAIKEQCNVKA